MSIQEEELQDEKLHEIRVLAAAQALTADGALHPTWFNLSPMEQARWIQEAELFLARIDSGL